ncbi:MAG: IS4 family transposase [Desulfobacterales bacterium]|nr:IS4 family transposase [Desulfobacterales bacterium]
MSQYRSNPTDFTRKRSFNFKSLSLFIISSIQSSIQRELDHFFASYNGKGLSEQFVTQSAFSQARLKIKPGAFKELTDDCTQHFYKHYKIKKWNGFRLIGIDGSEALLPKNEETIREYGEYTTNCMDKTVVLARLSKAYDVLNDISIDAILCNRKTGEHSLANQHLAHTGKGDLALFDRGYPSFDLFKNTLARGCHFCARVAVANWRAARKLVESGEKETIVEITPGYDLKKRYKQKGVSYQAIKCRFILVELPSGEKEVLITSLLDSDKYPHEIFKGLYHLRWAVEESYKKDKHRLQLENFSGTSPISILQDFHANILLGNITSVLSSGLEKEVNKKRKNTKYRYKINITTALSKVREALALFFRGIDILQLIGRLIDMFLSNVLPMRPGRSFPRNKGKRKRYYATYKPL